METALLVVIAAAILGLFAWVVTHRPKADSGLAETVTKVADAQIKLEERLRALTETTAERLDKHGEKTDKTLTALHERLVRIDSAQEHITKLSGQVVGLHDILSNKQARGAFGEVQLRDLVTAALPPSAYEFQCTLRNGRRADCLLRLPNPPGSIVIDSKFPLESYHALVNAGDDVARAAAGRAFTAAVLQHVKDIAERYILPGETAESALMFLPSEAVYAELHARFPDAVERSYRARVWIVSPTTLMATLNTVRAVLKDVQMREQAGLIQKEVRGLMKDIERLDTRTEALQKHFDQAAEDVRQIRISSEKIARGIEKVENVELGETAAPKITETVR